MKPRTVILSGRSLLLSLVGVSLKQSASLHVLEAATWVELEALVETAMPDVVICDLADASHTRVLPLLHRNPALQLIALDTETNRAVLLAGQETRALTLERVVDLVETRGPDPVR